MKTMTTNENATDTVLSALSEVASLPDVVGLSLSELVVKTGLKSADIRPVLDGTPTIHCKRKGRARLYSVSETYLLRRESELHILAETGSDEALNAATNASLYEAASLFGCSMRKKDTKAKLIANIKARRETLGYFYCVTEDCDEAVDAKGELCGACEDKAPKRRKPAAHRLRSSSSRKSTKPDVELALSAEMNEAIAKVVAEAPSNRAAQRDIANLLADASPDNFIDAEILRTILRQVDCLSGPNFTMNMKKDGFEAVREGRTVLGWKGK